MEKPVLSDIAMFYLADARKWAKFLAILGFIYCGMMLIGSIFVGFIMTMVTAMSPKPLPFPLGAFSIIYVFIAVVYFFPVYYLYKFSEDLKKALELGMEDYLTSAFRWLKSHYKYMGIMIIVGFALGIIFFFVAIFAGLFTAMSSGAFNGNML